MALDDEAGAAGWELDEGEGGCAVVGLWTFRFLLGGMAAFGSPARGGWRVSGDI